MARSVLGSGGVALFLGCSCEGQACSGLGSFHADGRIICDIWRMSFSICLTKNDFHFINEASLFLIATACGEGCETFLTWVLGRGTSVGRQTVSSFFCFKDHYFWEKSSSTPRPFPFFCFSSLTASGLSVSLVRVDEHVNVISRLKSVRQETSFRFSLGDLISV
jgi:hypothetical protein